MPTYKFEALDTSGKEVKDAVEAGNEEEASQKIKAQGYFVTKLTAVQAKAGKKKKKGEEKKGKARKTFTIGGVSQKGLTIFTRQFSTLQDAGLPVLRSPPHPGAADEAVGAQATRSSTWSRTWRAGP